MPAASTFATLMLTAEARTAMGSRRIERSTSPPASLVAGDSGRAGVTGSG